MSKNLKPSTRALPSLHKFDRVECIMQKPHITIIKSDLHKQGGLEKYTWQIIADFCALEATVTVLTSGNPQPAFRDPRLQIISLPINYPLSLLNILHFDQACRNFLKKHPTPIIFSLDRNRFQTHIRAGNGTHAAYLRRRCAEEGLLKGASFVLNPLHQTILFLEKKAFEHPELKTLFTNSEMVKQEILQLYKVDPEKIRVVHNGVEWTAMQNAFNAWETEKQKNLCALKLTPLTFQFLFIGHNFHRKGLEKLLHAFSLIKNEEFQLSVIGKDKNLTYFSQLAQRLGLKEKVFFFGPQKEIFPFYQMADCTVIPSIYDPFANVTVESLAMGVPVISSRNNGGHEILTAENGSVIESLNDTASFSQVLKSALGYPKTQNSSQRIRQSVKHLDFSHQIRWITETTIRPFA
jgi:UDP-glucose:(heptosyl)LPS alpha-1,3-glucosyltransferase